MGEFTVSFVDGSLSPFSPPAGLRFQPVRWSAMSFGGADMATVRVTGARAALWQFLHWLRYGVTIRTPAGGVVWDGYVHEVQIAVGAISVGLSLDTMYNAVNVLYAYTGGDGERSAETDWSTDSDSVTRFGRKDLLHSDSDVLPSMAADVQARLLADHQAAIPTIATNSGNAGEDNVMLICRGWWHMLDWRYYVDDEGLHSYEKTETPVSIGWALTASNLGFLGAPINRVVDMSARLDDLLDGDMFKTTSASNAGNNQIHTVTETAATQAVQSYTATSISFKASDQFEDTAGGLGFTEQYECVQMSGSTSGTNDGYMCVGLASGSRVESTSSFGKGGTITTQAAGPSVTISMGNSVKVTTDLTHEVPGTASNVALAGPTKACQSFTLPDAWLVGEVTLYVGRVGSPSDNAKCELCTNDGGEPDTVLGTSTVPGEDVEEGGGWLSFHFDPPVSLSGSTLYFIQFSRSGSTSATDYYTIAGSEDADYSGGASGLYIGSAWVGRTTGVDFAFQIWQVLETTTFIGNVISNISNGILTGTDVVSASGTYTKRNRADRVTAKEEIENLLQQGTSANKRIMANIVSKSKLVLWQEPTPNAVLDLVLRDNGGLYYPGGQRLEAGLLPVAQWVRIADIPTGDDYASVSPFFVDAIEYDAENAGWQITPKGNDDEFDFATMQG